MKNKTKLWYNSFYSIHSMFKLVIFKVRQQITENKIFATCVNLIIAERRKQRVETA